MTLRHLLLHGLTVAIESDLPAATLTTLLGEWPETAAAPADLHLSLRTAAAGEPAADLDGWVQVFFHGEIKGLHRDGRFLVVHRASSIAIDGGRMDVRIAAEELVDPAPFANGPLLIALAVALREFGLFHFHAGAVIDGQGRGLIVTGGSGSGKSTLTLALIALGFDYLGDDVLFVALRDQQVRLLAWPRPFHVGDATARAFPVLQAALGPRYSSMHDKRSLDGARVFPGRLMTELSEPQVVLFPSIEDRPDSTVEPMGAAEALGLMLQSSAMLAIDHVAASGEQMSLLGQLIDGARCFQVRLGRDLLEEPARCTRMMLEACGMEAPPER